MPKKYIGEEKSLGRVCLLLNKRHSCYRCKRVGERNHKPVCRCTVDATLTVINIFIKERIIFLD
jgi:ribosomal protein S6E (S10)